MKSMERFTPSYFHVLVFSMGYFIKEIENIFPVFPYVIETLVEVWENSKLRGNTHPTGSCSHFNFSFSQTSTRISIIVWKREKCFLCLKHPCILVFALTTKLRFGVDGIYDAKCRLGGENSKLPFSDTSGDIEIRLCF